MTKTEAYDIAEAILLRGNASIADFAIDRGVMTKGRERVTLLLRPEEAAAALTVSVSTFYEMIKEDERLYQCRVPINKGSVRYSPEKIAAYVATLKAEAAR